MKTNTLLTLSVFALLGSPFTSHAQSQAQIQELQLQAAGLVDAIKIEVQNRNVTYPDFPEVYATYLAEAEKQVGAYKVALNDIKSEAEAKLSLMATKEKAMAENYAQNPTPSSEDLLKIARSQNKADFNALKRDMNARYQAVLVNVISVGGRLLFPAERKAHWGAYAVLGASALSAGFGGWVGKFIALGWGWSMIVGGQMEDQGGFLSFNPKVNNNVGQELSDNGGLDGFRQKSAAAVFDNCKTSGCVYMISDVYGSWLKKTRGLNQDINLGEGIVLRALPLPNDEKVQRHLHKVAKVAARLKPDVAILK